MANRRADKSPGAAATARTPARSPCLPRKGFAFDERDLPCSMPVFELFLASDRAVHVVENLEVGEAIGLVLRREAGGRAGAMLVQPCGQIRRDSYVGRAVPPTCQDVDARFPRHGASPNDSLKRFIYCGTLIGKRKCSGWTELMRTSRRPCPWVPDQVRMTQRTSDRLRGAAEIAILVPFARARA